MTPLWRRAVRQALASRAEDVRMFGEALLRAHHCFDLGGVEALLGATATELLGAPDLQGGRKHDRIVVDLGERVTFPADSFWLEWGRAGLLCMGWAQEGRTGVALMLFTEPVDGAGRTLPIWEGRSLARTQAVHIGHLMRLPDGRFMITRPTTDISPGDLPPDITARHEQFVFNAFAALAVISSPAAHREAIEPHRGLARDIRREVARAPEVKASRIVLSGLAASEAGSPAATTTPRAYHFCRAHTRLRGGKVENVRAHWRGDPAFGIRIGHYEVKR